mgnify:CR=1 FL=1
MWKGFSAAGEYFFGHGEVSSGTFIVRGRWDGMVQGMYWKAEPGATSECRIERGATVVTNPVVGANYRAEEIDLRHGLFTVRRTLVPIRRVQHVDTESGPLQGMFELATVSFHTAAGSTKIPALLRGDVYHSDENLLTVTPSYRGDMGWDPSYRFMARRARHAVALLTAAHPCRHDSKHPRDLCDRRRRTARRGSR